MKLSFPGRLGDVASDCTAHVDRSSDALPEVVLTAHTGAGAAFTLRVPVTAWKAVTDALIHAGDY